MERGIRQTATLHPVAVMRPFDQWGFAEYMLAAPPFMR